MSAKRNRKSLQVVSGWEAVELIIQCAFYGFWQLLRVSFKRLWKGHRRKYKKNGSTVELTVDSSVGTHCYIKIMGVKYHYVEAGPKYGDPIIVLGDAPDPGLLKSSDWATIVKCLTDAGHRVITVDLRGTGGSESGGRADFSPPRVVEELVGMLEALGVSEHRPAVVIGHGIGGMLTWYLVHARGALVSKFVAVDAPHPSLYWQYPPAPFCQKSLHFIQWPYLPEQWLAEKEGGSDSDEPRWANSRACDWTGALNYVRGAAWWRIPPSTRAAPPALLVGRGGEAGGAAQLVASAERCAAATLRVVTAGQSLPAVLLPFLLDKDKSVEDCERRGLMGRMLGAVAEKGRGLSARLPTRLQLPITA
ncbi:epoxide hydrolase 2-like [Plutella xylostella]|uniref:epoxide hydrolase 2-like n=1 Tax=Plutella xylostella TaxID=51655 RepID=UPI002032E873|nr:epoxide hydrolase 2-like [Plutella xylostella]